LRLLVIRAHLAHAQGDYDRARLLLEEAMALAHRLAFPAARAFVVTMAADSAIERGDVVTGRALVNEGLGLARTAGRVHLAVLNLFNRARLAVLDGDEDLAQTWYQESLDLVQGQDLKGRPALIHYGLAYLACRKEEWQTAAGQIAEGFRISRRFEWPPGIYYGLDTWAVLAAARGDASRAARLAGACTAMRDASRAVRPPIWQTLLGRMSVPLGRPSDLALAAAWDEGRAMTLEQAVACALEEEDRG
jgi:non-specific serine/threonine protein kinase